MNEAPEDLLQQLAEAASLQVAWVDARGHDKVVEPDTLRSVLDALGLPCATPAQCRESLERLKATDDTGDGGMLIVRHDASLVVRRQGTMHYRLQLEAGSSVVGTARDIGGGQVEIPAIRRPGYHQLEMGSWRCTVAVTPKRAPSVEALLQRNGGGSATAARAWVLGAQVYGLRRAGEGRYGPSGATGRPAAWNVGGDFSLLGDLAEQAAEHGAAGLAISPVHAMFTTDPQRYSPYAPSSRLFLNAMYADPAVIFDAETLGAGAEQSAENVLDADGCMNWPAIQELRMAQLRGLYERFYAAPPEALADDLAIFRSEGGEALENHARYEALHAHFAGELGAGHGWRDWPAGYRNPVGEAVSRFAREHEREVRFHVFLQWLASRSMAAAQAQARKVMPIGLIADLAVGTDPRGSHAWHLQDQIMVGVSVGAPPDLFQPLGQDWGLTAFSPWALRRHAYDGFIQTLRATLAHAGGLRVDHVMGLARMWLVPSGAPPSKGVYIRYPMDEMMDLLMLEAWRHDAVIVGENLGTVPEGFNDALARRGFLGMSVLWFEQEAGNRPVFHASKDWPTQTMAMVTTHDLPTLRGWWLARDLEWRERQGEYEGDLAAEQRERRNQEKQALWSALQDAGMAPKGAAVPQAAPVAETLAYVASTPSVLLNVALEDLVGQEEQPNLPGAPSADAANRHPNWRRVLDIPVDELLRHADAPSLALAIRRARGALPQETKP